MCVLWASAFCGRYADDTVVACDQCRRKFMQIFLEGGMCSVQARNECDSITTVELLGKTCHLCGGGTTLTLPFVSDMYTLRAGSIRKGAVLPSVCCTECGISLSVELARTALEEASVSRFPVVRDESLALIHH
jgi:hypothetical protein